MADSPSSSPVGYFGYYDHELKKVVAIPLSNPPGIVSRVSIAGSIVSCEPNGETLDFGSGPVHVKDAQEKRALMLKHGVQPWSPGMKQKPDYDPAEMPTFAKFFHDEHKMPLKEAVGLVHGTGE